MNLVRPIGTFLPAFVRRRLSRARARFENAIAATSRSNNAHRPTARADDNAQRSARAAPARSSVNGVASKSSVKKRTRKAVSRRSEEDGGNFTGGELARYLGVSDTTISNMRRERKIYGYNVNQRAVAYPKTQIIQGGNVRPPRVVPGLDKVLAYFEDMDAAWRWLTAEQAAVGTKARTTTTPLSELRRGRIKAVMTQLESEPTSVA